MGRRGLSTAVCVAALLAAACGTRVDEPVAQSAMPSAGVYAGEEATIEQTSPVTVPTAPLPGVTAGPPTTPAAKGTTAPSTDPAVPGPSAGPTATPGASAPGRPAATDPAPGATPGGAVPAPTDRVRPRSTALFASVGSYSGPLAFAFLSILQGTQLWVKFINQQGGLNGHPVKLIVYDDAGDPARHRAQVQEAVEDKKVLGFLGNNEAITGRSSVAYIESKRIPVIGGSSAEAWANSSPMYFPQSTVGDALARTFVPSIARQMIPKGKKKLGSLICVEADTCGQTDDAIARDAAASGFEHVYRGRSTIAQPDFTAECLAARNAGVEVLFVALDQSSLGRVGRACGRQGYHPVYAMCGPCSADHHQKDPNLDGAIAQSTVFPSFQSGTPATDEFQRAFATLGQGLSPGSGFPLGWVSGKLLEKAGAALGEPPTTQALLEGLWTIKRDTLGGLTAPLEFTRDRPPAPVSCWFAMTIANGRWTSPDGFKLNCL